MFSYNFFSFQFLQLKSLCQQISRRLFEEYAGCVHVSTWFSPISKAEVELPKLSIPFELFFLSSHSVPNNKYCIFDVKFNDTKVGD